ncbi:MAG: ABC transporter permease [Actinomycetia bacterium]|nr:ABC transporter permease [Actinomycetes bacterium]
MRRVLGYAAAVVLIVGTWWGLAVWVGSPALPRPWPALVALVRALPALWPHVLVSLWRILAAMALGMGLALPAGVLIGRSRAVATVATPLIHLLYPIPKVVFLPVLLVLLGLGNAPKIVLIALTVFFQTLVSVRDAVRVIPMPYLAAVRAFGANRWQTVWHVVLPAALPGLFTSLRINVGTAIAILFLAESIAGDSGIGYYVMQMWAMIDYPAMFAGIIAMAAMGVAIYESLELIEHVALRWQRAQG